jgi:hypothetical protein
MTGILQAIARSLAERMFCPRPFLVSPAMVNGRTSFAQRLAGAVDLALDFATLGEYGLEPLPADGPACERAGDAGWEALARSTAGSDRPPRRGRCDAQRDGADRVRLRDLA